MELQEIRGKIKYHLQASGGYLFYIMHFVEVDLQKYKDNNKIKEQLKTGLILLLDYNVERQSEMYNPKKVNKLDSDKNENDVQIYLDTISKLHLKKLTIHI